MSEAEVVRIIERELVQNKINKQIRSQLFDEISTEISSNVNFTIKSVNELFELGHRNLQK